MSLDTQDGQMLLKLLAQSENEVARGRLIRQKNLFDHTQTIVGTPVLPPFIKHFTILPCSEYQSRRHRENDAVGVRTIVSRLSTIQGGQFNTLLSAVHPSPQSRATIPGQDP